MVEHLGEQPDDQADEGQSTEWKRPESDFFLEELIGLVNAAAEDGPAGLGITLTVGGLVITGELASGRHYYLESAKAFGKSLPEGDTRETVEKWVGGFSKIYDRPDIDERITFIHLKNVRFLSSTGTFIIPNGGESSVWWRGRLSEVSGFMLGTFGDRLS